MSGLKEASDNVLTVNHRESRGRQEVRIAVQGRVSAHNRSTQTSN